MKKHFLTLIAIASFTTVSLAQIGVNADNSAPHPSAQLDIKSNDKGLLIPRLTTVERNAVQNPEIGLMVFDKDLQEIYIFNSDGWKQGTLSKLPLEIFTDKLFGIKVTNNNSTNSPFGLSAAGYFNYTGSAGHALYARSGGNLPTVIIESVGTSFALNAKSTGNTTAYFQNTNNNMAIDGTTGYNNFIRGENNSFDYATAKFINNDNNGKALEANARVEINVNNLVGLKITNSATSASTSAEFIHNGPNGIALLAKSSGAGNAVEGRTFGVGAGIGGFSDGGPGGYFSSQTNMGAIILNNSSTLPTARIINSNSGSTALEVTGNITLNGKIILEPYQYPTLENNWVNTGGEWNTAKYYKDKQGIVHLEGVLNDGTGILIFNLPVGYRPSKRSIFTISSASGSGRVDVFPNGNVEVMSGQSLLLSLDGISFKVE